MRAFLRALSETLQRLVDALDTIGHHLAEVLTRWDSQGEHSDRLLKLEMSRDAWEAQVEAEFLKADSRYKAARSSEERARTMVTHAEAFAGDDEGDEDGLRAIQELLAENAEGSEDGQVPELREVVAVSPKVRAQQLKFMRR